MKSLSRELILETAHRMVAEQGMEKVNLSKVANELGTTHAAIYKYFTGKEELWTALASSWLNHELAILFPFETENYSSTKEIVHDWLWSLSESKYQSYLREPEMFKLYTTYIDGNPIVWARHIEDLVGSLKAASKIEDNGLLHALLLAFSWFSAPAFAEKWLLIDIKREFEGVWRVVEAGILE
ncbi:TetR/AcrR family transcriptional regulator [Bacillus sp. IB182487]|uniref:TetR/AcrR family transcriptional regulator n=2 Tax=Metabacillus arenae TaxID=2771434 RepID=A0A926NEL9_9BACI|nr:TetR/AcrR family transcriptional regulator [Metabacillus arenae]